MTQEEIIQAISDDKMMPFIQPDQLSEIVNFVIENYKPSLPSNLDEAAIDAAQLDMQDRQIMEATNDERLRYSRIFRRGFKAGAEWLAGQGINAESEVCKLVDRAWVTPINEKQFARDVYNNFVAGDKVIVQIRKKQ